MLKLVDLDSILTAGAVSLVVSLIVSLAVMWLKEFWIEPRKAKEVAHQQWLQDQLRFVYGPLHSAVLSMKAGRDSIPEFTVGTPINAWTQYPEITGHIIDIFSSYPHLVDNDRVLKGWIRKESELRKAKEFWLDKNAYEWFDNIENEYERIRLEIRK